MLKRWFKIRYIEYQIIVGDAPPGLISNDLRDLAGFDPDIEAEVATQDVEEVLFYPVGKIHHLSEKSYVWNFSLVYRNKSFDIIKWKTAFAWKNEPQESEEILMEKALFIGTIAGVFFILIDENIDDNFNKLADIMDNFIEKTQNSPFLVYGIIENKKKAVELKTNPEMLKNLADVKKWVSQHGGEFRLENLKEIRMNRSYLINEYSHFILTKIKSKSNYPNLELGEVHFLDQEDIATLKEIETALTTQAKGGETVDQLLSDLFFTQLKKPEFQEEIEIQEEVAVELEEEIEKEVIQPPPSKIKIILEEIRRGIRRQCPKCFNKDRNMIYEEIDKNNIIMKNPNIYGWKYRCGACSHEWKTEKDWKTKKND
ncbi:MAG: hypothetical protein GY870_02270 [archaeon]|nr:hypothetical protein [archaeon]